MLHACVLAVERRGNDCMCGTSTFLVRLFLQLNYSPLKQEATIGYIETFSCLEGNQRPWKKPCWEAADGDLNPQPLALKWSALTTRPPVHVQFSHVKYYIMSTSKFRNKCALIGKIAKTITTLTVV